MLAQVLASPVAFAAVALLPGFLLLVALLEAAFPGQIPQALVNLLSNLLDVSIPVPIPIHNCHIKLRAYAL